MIISQRSSDMLEVEGMIPSGKSAVIWAKPQDAFHLRRLLFTGTAFRVPWLRWIWTGGVSLLGTLLRLFQRGLARLLRVDLWAVEIPLSLRERLLFSLGRAATRLSKTRGRWQETQSGFLTVHQLVISGRPLLKAPLPADLFSSPAIDSFVNFQSTCLRGQSLVVVIENASAHTCRLGLSLIGRIS